MVAEEKVELLELRKCPPSTMSTTFGPKAQEVGPTFIMSNCGQRRLDDSSLFYYLLLVSQYLCTYYDPVQQCQANSFRLSNAPAAYTHHPRPQLLDFSLDNLPLFMTVFRSFIASDKSAALIVGLTKIVSNLHTNSNRKGLTSSRKTGKIFRKTKNFCPCVAHFRVSLLTPFISSIRFDASSVFCGGCHHTERALTSAHCSIDRHISAVFRI